MTGTEIVKVIEISGVPKDAGSLVTLLEAHGGSLKRFLSPYPDDQHEAVLAYAEQFLSEDKDQSFQRRWNAAIRRNQVARLRLLQHRSLERLEKLTQPSDSDLINWPLMSKEAAAHKMLLGDLLAAQVHAVKQKTVEVSGDEDDADARDAAEAVDALEM